MTLTLEQYHADTSRISKSGLDLIHRSPKHYWARYLDPNRLPPEDKKHFIVGTISHTVVLEQHRVDQDFFTLDEKKEIDLLLEIGGASPRATKRYKEWVAGEKALNPEKVLIDTPTWDLVRRMRDSLHAHPMVQLLLQDGIIEDTVIWEDSATGAPCRCRPDFRNAGKGYICDLKFVKDASAEGFGKAAYDHRYHVQAPFYLDGLRENDIKTEGFFFIACEKEPPYAVQVFHAQNDVLTMGRAEYEADLLKYMECLEYNDWPAYSDKVQPLKLPGWAFKRA